ncbi:DUF202 domain-containing protein [Rhodococcus sp. NPDC059968]|uniref:DUF202 domain-containing protein n=1 Tax=Rhodococcus sp. NPDC059968 TaxID=3347017 RepID=UPI00366EAF3A
MVVIGSADRDPGLQPDRTALAWRRTTLSAAATTVALLHIPPTHSDRAASLTLVPMAVLLLAITYVSHRRGRSLRRGTQGMTGHHALLVALLVTATAIAAAATAAYAR